METVGSRTEGQAASPAGVTGPVRLGPTPPGVVYLWTISLFALTMLLLGQNLVFLLGALVLGCGVVTWFLARRNLAGLEAERDLPLRTRVGLPTPVTWTIRNGHSRPALGLEIEDRLVRGVRPARLQVEFPLVQGGSEASVSSSLTFGRRGRFELGSAAAVLWSRYPLGLFRAARALRRGAGILVRPAEGRVTERLRRKLAGRLDAEARRQRVWRGDDVIYGVRDFREGDDPRRIHWRSTARRGALVVSEWRAEQGREAVIVLGRSQGAGPRARKTFERAVSLAATIWRACARENVRARLVLGLRSERVLEESGRGLDRGLDALATAPAQSGRRPWAALRRLQAGGAPRTVIYIGTGAEAGIERDLAAAAGPGGAHLILRADLRSLVRWVRGLP